MNADEIYKSFDAYRKQLQEGAMKSSEAFDKNLILISSGGLALSMTFVEKIGGTDPTSISTLLWSWYFLGGTLLLSLTSHFISSELHIYAEHLFNKIEWSLEEGGIINRFEKGTVDQNKFSSKFSRYHRKIFFGRSLVRALDFISFALLIIGVFLLIRFASVNTGSLKQDNNKEITIFTTTDSLSNPSLDKANP